MKPAPLMPALVKHAAGAAGLSLKQVAIPEPGAEEVLVEVRAAAICGTDLHIQQDAYPVTMPVTIGHEFSGVISRLGARVAGWQVGERVIAEGNVENCGACPLCLDGHRNLCPQNKYLGIKRDGVFARYVSLPARLLHRIPGNLSFAEAALAEPAAVAIDALLEKNRIEPGTTVVILGCGPIALLAGQVARAAGAARVLLTGRESAVKARFPVAAATGVFDHLLNVEREDPVACVQGLTGGLGADLILDTTGHAGAVQQAFQMVRRFGTIAMVGMGDPVLEVPWPQMMREVVKLHFCRGTTFRSFARFCQLAADGRLTLSPLISHQFPLPDWQRAFAVVENRDAIKALLIP